MPLHLRVPLPGPFVYTRRIGGDRPPDADPPPKPGPLTSLVIFLTVFELSLIPAPFGAIAAGITVLLAAAAWVALTRRNR